FGPYWSKWDHKLIYHYHIWKIETSPALNKQFAYYALLNITEALKASAHGVAMPHITKAGMEAWEIQLPPISEQKIIAEKLDTLLAQVESTKARLEQIPQILKRFRQAVLGAAVSGKLTEDWRDNSSLSGWIEGKLGEFIKKPSYGTSSKSNKEGLIPVLRMGNLQGGKLDWTDLVYTSDTIEIEKYKLEYNDVLFNRTNSPELVGKTAIYKSEQPAIYAGYLIRVQCLPDLNPDYLNYHLNSILGRQYCYSVKSDGVSQSNINAQKLIAYPITVPPLPEQHEIVRRVEQLFAYADTIEKQVNNALARVNNLTQSILAKAFRGELTAQWRAENPELISGENSAAALLEKIKAERAASGGKKASRKKS
ncbi:TPA: restriction endonuclease subunit S, partial [Escherichia coli]